MNRSKQLTIGAVLAGMVALGVGGVAWWRVREARVLSQPYAVHDYGGTNYVVRLHEITVGKAATGHVVLVALRLENPNRFAVVLNRNWFILVDAQKEYYLPSTMGTQTPSITVPAGGIVEEEILSFAVEDNAFAGTLGLQIGQNYWIMLKDPQPFTRKLKPGEFVSFRRREW